MMLNDINFCKTDDFLCFVINHYGRENQALKAIEEMSELQKELCKWVSGARNEEHIEEEIADVEIMIMQLRQIFRTKSIDMHKDFKLLRLAERVHDDCSL